MELVMGVLLFGLVIYIKLGSIKEFLAALKENKGNAIMHRTTATKEAFF